MRTPIAPTAEQSTAELQAQLEDAPHRVWWRRRSVWAAAVLLLVASGGALVWQASSKNKAAPAYVTEVVGRGKLTLSVNANGTLQPTRSVNIGSELSGTVKNVRVDVNDQVKKGQVLVELDTSKLQDQVARSRAALQSAVAQVAQATRWSAPRPKTPVRVPLWFRPVPQFLPMKPTSHAAPSARP